MTEYMSHTYSVKISEHFTHGGINSSQLYEQLVSSTANFNGFAVCEESDVFEIYFTNSPESSDITAVLAVVDAHTPVYVPTFTTAKTYSTGKLQVKNTEYTVVDRFIFKGSAPIKFSVNSYLASSGSNYSVRFVNAVTKEIIASATFTNTGSADINEVGVYTGNLSNAVVVIETQAKISSAMNKAYIEGVVLDYN